MRPTLAIASTTLLGTLFYLALAVIAYGGITPFFSHPVHIALTVVLFALSTAALFSGGNLNPGVPEDRVHRWVLTAFSILAHLSGSAPAYKSGRATCREGVYL